MQGWLAAFFLALALPFSAAAQGLTADELSLQIDCRAGDGPACQALEENLRDRIARGDIVEFDARGLLEDSCAADVRTACIRLNSLNRLQGGRDSGASDENDSAVVPTPAIETKPAAVPAAPQISNGGLPAWVWVLVGAVVGIGGFLALIFAVPEHKKDPAPVTPSLPASPIRAMPRRPSGVLEGIKPDTHQLLPWSNDRVMTWAHEQLEKTRPLITDHKFRELAENPRPAPPNRLNIGTAAMLYLVERDPDVDTVDFWKEPDYRFMCLCMMVNNIAPGAYLLANHMWEGRTEVPDTFLFELFRFDADKDFAPAGVNLYAILTNKGIDPSPETMTVPEMERYLRHFFDLGAPFAYLQIMSTLFDFYVHHYGPRDDEGYVAACLRRAEAFFPDEVRAMRDSIERLGGHWDLDDRRVDHLGVMRNLEQSGKEPLQ